jgi:hypothetical protein
VRWWGDGEEGKNFEPRMDTDGGGSAGGALKVERLEVAGLRRRQSLSIVVKRGQLKVAGCGLRVEGWKVEGLRRSQSWSFVVNRWSFSTPHSALRTPHSAFVIRHSPWVSP